MVTTNIFIFKMKLDALFGFIMLKILFINVKLYFVHMKKKTKHLLCPNIRELNTFLKNITIVYLYDITYMLSISLPLCVLQLYRSRY